MLSSTGFLGRFAANFSADPLSAILYLGASGLVLLWAVRLILKDRPERLVWSVFALVAISLLLGNLQQADDASHHLYRLVAIADQWRAGDFSLFVQNDVTGETLPVFVFYSFAPYVLPAALNIAGLSATLSYKLALVFYFFVLTHGLVVLTRLAPERAARHAVWWASFLFLSSTYIVVNWVMRSALAEVCVIALFPWCVIFAGTRKRSLAGLVAVTSLQMICHPIVVLHALIGQSSIALLISEEKKTTVFWRIIVASGVAAVVSSPFWLPQALLQDTTLGPRGLSMPFSGSFLSPLELLQPLFQKSIGLWLILAVVLITPAILRSRQPFAIFALVSFFTLLALQTRPLVAVTSLLPLLDKSALVWRLMFSCAALAFGLLLAYRGRIALAWLRGLSGASLATLVALVVGGTLNHTAGALAPPTDRAIYADYSYPERPFGGLEFYPDYARLPQVCAPADDMERRAYLNGQRIADLPYAALRTQAGAVAETAYVKIHAGPYGYVTYRSEGGELAPFGACGLALVLGPVRPGAVISVDETQMNRLFAVRIADAAAITLAALCALFLSLRAGGRAPKMLPGESLPTPPAA